MTYPEFQGFTWSPMSSMAPSSFSSSRAPDIHLKMSTSSSSPSGSQDMDTKAQLQSMMASMSSLQAAINQLQLGGVQQGEVNNFSWVPDTLMDNDVRRVMSSLQGETLSVRTEGEFEDTMERWESYCHGVRDCDRVLRIIIRRVAAPHLRYVVEDSLARSTTWNELKDLLARKLFPESLYIGDLERQILKVSRKRPLTESAYLLRKDLCRYAMLCIRWGRLNMFDDRRKKDALIKKLPTNQLGLFLSDSHWKSMTFEGFVEHCLHIASNISLIEKEGNDESDDELGVRMMQSYPLRALEHESRKRPKFNPLVHPFPDQVMKENPPLTQSSTSSWRTSKSSSSSETPRTVRCYNCGQPGHRTPECTAPAKRCETCNRKGHTSETCFRRKFPNKHGGVKTGTIRATRDGVHIDVTEENTKKDFLEYLSKYAFHQAETLEKAKTRAKDKRVEKKEKEKRKDKVVKSISVEDETSSESEGEPAKIEKIYLHSLDVDDLITPSWYIDACIGGTRVMALLDTGAVVSAIPVQFWETLSEDVRKCTPTISPGKRRLIGAGGQNLRIFCIAEIGVQVRNCTAAIRFFVTYDLERPVMGMDAIKILDITAAFGRERLFIGDEEITPIVNPILPPQLCEIQESEQPICRRGEGASDCDYNQAVQVFEKYREVWENPLPGKCTLVQHDIDTLNARPVRFKARRVLPSKQEELKLMIDKLLSSGVIRLSDSNWASPIVLVPKPDGTIRLCIDYRELNKVTVRDSYPLPNITHLLDQLSGSSLFSTLDLASGYHQIKMIDSAIHKTAFITPSGLYEFLVMPFGLVNAPATFQRVMNTIFDASPFRNNLGVYMDDIIIHTNDVNLHLQVMHEVLSKLVDAGLYVNIKKTVVMATRIKYLGFIIEAGFQYIDKRQIEVLNKLPPPKDVKAIRRFLGLSGYFRKFIRDYSTLVLPLTSLLKKNMAFTWGKAQNDAWTKVKEIIASDKVMLMLPLEGKLFTLDTDASILALGAVLQQEDTNGDLRPIAFASKTLSSAEKNWTTRELEAYAIVWAILHFGCYLKWQPHFVVRSDQQSLKWIWKSDNRKIIRWALLLQEYNFEVEYRKGAQQGHVDIFSRDIPVDIDENDAYGKIAVTPSIFCLQTDEVENLPISSTTFPTFDDIKKAQNDESSTPEFKKMSLFKDPHDLWTNRYGRVYMPIMYRRPLLYFYHFGKFGAHQGIQKVYRRISKVFWWPNLLEDITTYSKFCLTCQRRLPIKKTFLQGNLLSHVPCYVIGIDVVGPLQYKDQLIYIFTIIDHCTKYAHAECITALTGEHLWSILYSKWVVYFGAPRFLLSDNAQAFRSHHFLQQCRDHGIEKLFSSVYHPEGNGIVESFHIALKKALFCVARTSMLSPQEILEAYLLAYRSTPHISTGETPYFLTTGSEMIVPGLQSWIEEPASSRRGRERLKWIVNFREEIFDNAARRSIELMLNKRKKGPPERDDLKEGQLVIYSYAGNIRDKISHEWGGKKSTPRWSRPCRIVQKAKGEGQYKVQDLWSGDIYFKQREELIVLSQQWPQEALEAAHYELVADIKKYTSIRNNREEEKRRHDEYRDRGQENNEKVEDILAELAKNPESMGSNGNPTPMELEEDFFNSSYDKIFDELPMELNSTKDLPLYGLTSPSPPQLAPKRKRFLVCLSWNDVQRQLQQIISTVGQHPISSDHTDLD